MFHWFGLWAAAWQKPSAMGDKELARTIDQIRTCRGHLADLMYEARLAQQMLEITEGMIEDQRRDTKKRLESALEPVTFTTERRQREHG